MKQILAMSKPNAICAIHCATADGFFKVNSFLDFAEPFGSAFFFTQRHPERSEGSRAV
ncbi:MAG: hypothetical protein IKH55_11635 [Fibrobacter sp.]|nr:hypothetical protein [Fibrobacter sp.]